MTAAVSSVAAWLDALEQTHQPAPRARAGAGKVMRTDKLSRHSAARHAGRAA